MTTRIYLLLYQQDKKKEMRGKTIIFANDRQGYRVRKPLEIKRSFSLVGGTKDV